MPVIIHVVIFTSEINANCEIKDQSSSINTPNISEIYETEDIKSNENFASGTHFTRAHNFK